MAAKHRSQRAVAERAQTILPVPAPPEVSQAIEPMLDQEPQPIPAAVVIEPTTTSIPILPQALEGAPLSAEIDEVRTDTAPIPTLEHRLFARRGGGLPKVPKIDWQTVGLSVATSSLIGIVTIIICVLVVVLHN